jgi:hypothetical protein
MGYKREGTRGDYGGQAGVLLGGRWRQGKGLGEGRGVGERKGMLAGNRAIDGGIKCVGGKEQDEGGRVERREEGQTRRGFETSRQRRKVLNMDGGEKKNERFLIQKMWTHSAMKCGPICHLAGTAR